MILALDTENTTWNMGSPFDERNFNVCISYAHERGTGVVFTGENGTRSFIQSLIDKATTIVGFNLKYDLHWLRKLGYNFAGKRVWCGQTAEFALRRMQSPYPSLNGVAAHYNLGSKLSVIEEEYWKKGINTHEIPREVLAEYAVQDACLTMAIYHAQTQEVSLHQRVLFSLLMQDLLVLEEMEWNGLRFDKEGALRKAEAVEAEIAEIQKKVDLYHTVPNFNWGSSTHLSALLYGGTIIEEKRIPIGFYKTGEKAGQPRYKIELVQHHLPRRYSPIRGSASAREGTWSVDEKYLTRLNGKRDLIDNILKIKGLKKLVSTYLRGLPQKQEEGHFPDGYIHGQLVQCVAKTGRLASNSPNLQNISGEATDIFISRYNDGLRVSETTCSERLHDRQLFAA